MNVADLLDDLFARDIELSVNGDTIEFDAPAGVLTDADCELLREHKQDVVRRLRLAQGLPVDDEAGVVLAADEVNAADLPICDSCGRCCDTELLNGSWRCSLCDPDAESRRNRTLAHLERVQAIRQRKKLKLLAQAQLITCTANAKARILIERQSGLGS